PLRPCPRDLVLPRAGGRWGRPAPGVPCSAARLHGRSGIGAARRRWIRHGVIGNTPDFGSAVSGSRPDGGTTPPPRPGPYATVEPRGAADVESPAAVIVLAAGAGTRMKSRTPKVLHSIGGRSLLVHAVTAAEGTSPSELVVVLRH